jgi:hypothetical protein
MTVRAKFRLVEWKNCEGYTYDETGKGHPCIVSSLVFVPVSGSSPENKKFWSATPSGRIELGIVNPEAAKEFNLLKEYYVDFTEVEAL